MALTIRKSKAACCKCCSLDRSPFSDSVDEIRNLDFIRLLLRQIPVEVGLPLRNVSLFDPSSTNAILTQTTGLLKSSRLVDRL